MTALGRKARARAAVAALVLSSAPAAWAYRTIEDYPEVPDGARVRWPNGTFEFWTHDRGIDSVDAAQLAETSRRAFFAWAGAPCSHLAPIHLGISPYPAEPDDGMNTIEIVEEGWEALGFPADAAGANDILYGELEDGSWAILEADIYVNAEHHLWTTASSPADDERSLLGVLTHEGGHALGLLHPCEPDGADDAPACAPEDAPGDLMSPYYTADQLYPEAEDWAGLCYLYSACEAEGCEPGFRCQDGECVSLDEDGDGDCDEAMGGQGNEACKTPKRRTGAECSESNQCVGNECVAGVEDVPICTHRCGEDEEPCPGMWSCTTVEDRKVCIPPNPEPGCNCEVARARQFSDSSRLPWAIWIAGGLAAWLLRRAPRRRRTTIERRNGRAENSSFAEQQS